MLVFSNKYGTVDKIKLDELNLMLRFQLDVSIFGTKEIRVRFKNKQEKARFVEELTKLHIIPKPFDFSYVFKKA